LFVITKLGSESTRYGSARLDGEIQTPPPEDALPKRNSLVVGKINLRDTG
jgi:hypothetical protein